MSKGLFFVCSVFVSSLSLLSNMSYHANAIRINPVQRSIQEVAEQIRIHSMVSLLRVTVLPASAAQPD